MPRPDGRMTGPREQLRGLTEEPAGEEGYAVRAKGPTGPLSETRTECLSSALTSRQPVLPVLPGSPPPWKARERGKHARSATNKAYGSPGTAHESGT